MIDTLAANIDPCQYDGVAATNPIQWVAECCSPVFLSPLDQDRAGQLAAALKVLADPARLRILSLIANHPRREVCQAEFTRPLGLSQPTVSHHLKVLHDAGLLRREQRGSWAYYSIQPDLIDGLRETLAVGR
jgi:ArsR family transcriptional regulator, arsenate/arsenite/antimonite-responsive transcriptional repressor